jgi:CRISPR-associated endonuclease/helicase Cas3
VPNVYLFSTEETIKSSPYPWELLAGSILIFNGLFAGKSEEEIKEEIVNAVNEQGKNSLEIEEGEILLSEYDKYRLVWFFYQAMEETNTEYIKTFFNTLSILDAGYVSSRKSEAQKVFRRITDVSVVPENLLQAFYRDVVAFVSDDLCEERKSFAAFKRDILSKYVVSVSWAVAKEAVTKGAKAFHRLFNLASSYEQELFGKYPLQSWLDNVFVVPGDYSDLGFTKVKAKEQKAMADDGNIL